MSTISNPLADPLYFDDLQPIEVPVKYGNKAYILREASEDAAVKYRNAQARGARFGADGKPVSVESVADKEPLLVSLCLYHADKEGHISVTREGRPDPRFLVPLQVILTWPPRIVDALFKRLLKISELDDAPDTPETLAEKITVLQEQRESLLKNG